MADIGPEPVSQRRRLAPGAAIAADSDEHVSASEAEEASPLPAPAAVGSPNSVFHALQSVTRTELGALTGIASRVAVITAVIAANVTAILLTVSKEVMDERTVDPATCGGCSCWDGLSKAPYDKGDFKFIYWNVTWTTGLILGIMLFYIVLFERALEALVRAVLSKEAALFTLVAFVACMPGNLYGAGTVYHYLNDRNYGMLPTQAFFSVTELMTIVAVWRCLVPAKVGDVEERGRREIYHWIVWVSSLCHVVLAGMDQIVYDLLFKPDVTRHAYARAVIFSSTDVLVFIWASYHLGMLTRPQGSPAAALGFGIKLRNAAAIAAAVCVWYRMALPLV
jgi:hypothetical protein